MSGSFFADPDTMDGTMDGAVSAADALRAAMHSLSNAESMIQSSLSWGSGASARPSTFIRHWREEFDRLARLLVMFDEGVRAAAHVYRDGERSLTAAIDQDAS